MSAEPIRMRWRPCCSGPVGAVNFSACAEFTSSGPPSRRPMIEPQSIDPLTACFCRGLSSMPMQAESLEVLEKADVPPAQARPIVRAIELEITGAKDTLATKHDVLVLRHDVELIRRDLRAEV